MKSIYEFSIPCQYADEDGTNEDVYQIYEAWCKNVRVIDEYTYNYATESVAVLMDIMLYATEDSDGTISFDMGEERVHPDNVPIDLNPRYKFYFEINELIKSKEKVISLDFEEWQVDELTYNKLFYLVCKGYRFKYIDKVLDDY